MPLPPHHRTSHASRQRSYPTPLGLSHYQFMSCSDWKVCEIKGCVCPTSNPFQALAQWLLCNSIQWISVLQFTKINRLSSPSLYTFHFTCWSCITHNKMASIFDGQYISTDEKKSPRQLNHMPYKDFWHYLDKLKWTKNMTYWQLFYKCLLR